MARGARGTGRTEEKMRGQYGWGHNTGEGHSTVRVRPQYGWGQMLKPTSLKGAGRRPNAEAGLSSSGRCP
eukprot:365906-Chlamydomonas_euryale.AAC.19